MNSKLIRLPKVIEMVGLSRSTIFNKAKAGSFPQPMKLSVRAVAWRESEVYAWIDGLKKVEVAA